MVKAIYFLLGVLATRLNFWAPEKPIPNMAFSREGRVRGARAAVKAEQSWRLRNVPGAQSAPHVEAAPGM